MVGGSDMSVSVDASGIRDLELYFDRFPTVAREAMSIAINETARGPALQAARRNITEQVAFPEGYLDDNRLKVTQFATPTRLEAKISGRDRPTSLARFTPRGTTLAQKGRQPANPGVNVTVNPGRTSRFASGFLIGLRNGNVGFAIRLRPGESVRGVARFQPIQIFKDVYLLYGPSVDQVFQSVADEIAPEVTSALEAEFMRQFVRLSGADQ